MGRAEGHMAILKVLCKNQPSNDTKQANKYKPVTPQSRKTVFQRELTMFIYSIILNEM